MLGFSVKSTPWQRYRPLSSDSEKSDSDNTSLSDLRSLLSWRAKVVAIAPWVLTLLFASLSLYQYVLLNPGRGTYEKGWATDFASIRNAIKVEDVRFDGGASFIETGEYVMTWGNVRYFGPPSPEIDWAWEELTWGRFILLTEEEAREAFHGDYGDDIEALWSPRHGGYYTGFSMYHTLHCLNRLRQAFHPDYYPMDENPNHIIHRDHCFEQIRQYIVCAGDMTPVPTVFNHLRDISYVDSNLKHTCRSLPAIRQWMSERYNGSTAVQPKCPNGTYYSMGKLRCDGY